jgi:branched-chain amino acid transport system substrate-binding protein
VPNDAAQGPVVANWMTQKLKWKRVYIIDDQETYSQGLADGVGKILNSRGVKVTRDSISQSDSDFSSKIAKIPNNTQGIYIPWQLAPQAQAFGQQLKAAGKGKIKLFGSDGLFAPGVWKIAGSYDSAFPYNPNSPVVTAYVKAHKGNGEFFGLPSYVAAQVVVGAVTRACADGKASRAEVRKQIAKTKLKTSILGFPVSFASTGEMHAPATYGVYQIQSDGSFKRIG